MEVTKTHNASKPDIRSLIVKNPVLLTIFACFFLKFVGELDRERSMDVNRALLSRATNINFRSVIIQDLQEIP